MSAKWKLLLTFEHLSWNVTEEHIRELCGKYGLVKSVEFTEEVGDDGPAYHVTMSTRRDSVAAWSNLSGALLDGRTIVVSLSKLGVNESTAPPPPRDPPPRRKSPPPPNRRRSPTPPRGGRYAKKNRRGESRRRRGRSSSSSSSSRSRRSRS
eukprot:PhF_6_TR17575/c0_g1_i1/m.26737